ncbi:MAG: preprotein translocase subunit SecA [Clostridiales bacterium]|jgi:preprotein translocase subunit SecA|nr:preprotein translocase subunit SecA [Clostridiales bacterium]
MSFLSKLFGSYSDKEIKRIVTIADRIEALDEEYRAKTDAELRALTDLFKERYANGETLDSLLPEAYAAVREAAFRANGEKPFRVQLIGGIILHQGRIAEMRTGEGKTLTSTLPAYLNAITGEGVHVVTVNDYLARRDSEWMGRIHNFLGLSVGVILHDMESPERRAAYACDITYATNNELGFDYLRDNMVVAKEQMVQRGLSFAIIDEIDSILIDEARTPLIISGSSGKSTQLYKIADAFVKKLEKGRIINEETALSAMTREAVQEEGDFVVDEKAKASSLTEQGVDRAEKYFGVENLADPDSLEIQHHINNALRANYIMFRDQDYVVSNDGEIVIVDEFTGRLMPGRRYSDGLHQAIEAKENVTVNRESKTLATITFQNFFNKYVKKSGMTGTAVTEEGEFREIYGMDVVSVPTNQPVVRTDHPDVIYKTEAGKFRAVVEDIKESCAKGQPVLVGTITIDKSERISELLKKEGIPHQVLNAKYHEKEAEIVALAGQKGAITIATNMAGRGTDIKLGEGVPAAGGLKIVGTERHESRRIDNQLRGRSGRQGDVGESRFYISLEDELMRLFGGDRVTKMIDMLGVDEDTPIEHGMLTKAIENAQKKVENNNFEIRKHLLEYDQVMNEQREIIYGERLKVLDGADLRENIINMIRGVAERAVEVYTGGEEFPDDWDIAGLNEFFHPFFHKAALVLTDEARETMSRDKLKETLVETAVEVYEQKEAEITPEQLRHVERIITLRVVDERWMNHIDDMDQMRQGISLRAYAQRDPLLEYKFVSHDMFEELSNNIQVDTLKILFNLRLAVAEQEEAKPVAKEMFTNRDESASKEPIRRKTAKVGRNDPCPCGSGKKYKSCCGANE